MKSECKSGNESLFSLGLLIFSYSTHHQTRMEMALVVTHLLWLPILCRQLVQRVRSCLDHQERRHAKYHEYLSRYCNNGNFSYRYFLLLL